MNDFVYLKSIIPAQSATTALPMSRTLSLYSVNLKQFCDKFNTETSLFLKNLPVIVVISINLVDFSFSINILTIPVNFLIFFFSKNSEIVLSDFFKILKIKQYFKKDLDLKLYAHSLYATCFSMGIKVI